MLQFQIYYAELKTKLDSFKQFLDDVHYEYYKKTKDKKRNDRKPELKITEDIVSAKYWIQTKNGEEKRIIIDGEILINDIKINTVTVDGKIFKDVMIKELMYTLKRLSKYSNGFLYGEINYIPIRIGQGTVTKYNDLLEEIFNDLPEDKKKKHALSLDLLFQDTYGILV